jgi:hypothetical protein
LREATGEKPIILQIKIRKWRWIGHTLRKNKHWIGIRGGQKGRRAKANVEKGPFCRKQKNAAKQGVRLRCWRLVQLDGDAAQMPHIPNGTNG